MEQSSRRDENVTGKKIRVILYLNKFVGIRF